MPCACLGPGGPVGVRGTETWELISATAPVFLIPKTSDAREVLARVPTLAPVSEAITLVGRNLDGTLPGLHDGKVSRWQEELVLQLLNGVKLSPTADEQAD